jgi:hypothetical protein
MRSWALLLVLAPSLAAASTYDANGVELGAAEHDVKKHFPSAFCKALEWASNAADRRCDDGKIVLGGVQARITFYLRKDAVQAFDVRFDTKDLEPLTKFLKSRYGAPFAETRDTVQGKGQRVIYKVRWERGRDQAVLTAQLDKRRGELTVSRGNFEEEIYRIR